MSNHTWKQHVAFVKRAVNKELTRTLGVDLDFLPDIVMWQDWIEEDDLDGVEFKDHLSIFPDLMWEIYDQLGLEGDEMHAHMLEEIKSHLYGEEASKRFQSYFVN